MNKLRWAISALAILALTACNGQPKSGWTFKESKDPISGASTVSAEARLSPKDDETLLADVNFSCSRAGGASDPFQLFMTLTTYNSKAAEDSYPPAALSGETVEYRIDDLGGGTISESEQVESPYNNQFKINVAAAVGGSPTIAEKLMPLIPEGGLAANVIGLSALAGMAAAAEEGVTVSANQATGSVLKVVLDNPQAAAELKQPLARVTNNYQWRHKMMVLRFRAQLPQGANDFVLEVPLDGEEVTKVAAACGWMAKPPQLAALPAAATIPNLAAAEIPSADQARSVNCEIAFGYADPGDQYKGPCLFEPTGDGKGSFRVYLADNKPIIANTSAITIDVIRPGVGQATLNNSSGAGHNTVDNELTREGACWIDKAAEDDAISVCVQ